VKPVAVADSRLDTKWMSYVVPSLEVYGTFVFGGNAVVNLARVSRALC
jgi:hypothetical protein